MAADMLGSAVVQETVSHILSNMEDKYKAGSDDAKEHLERLEMAHIRLEGALRMSQGWNITSAPLLRWRSKLKRAAQDCGRTLQRIRREEEAAAEEGVRDAPFANRMARHIRSFVSSILLFGSNNNNNNNGSSGERSMSAAAAVQRFERFADGAAEFLRFLELGGGAPRGQRMSPDPLVRHLLAGDRMIRYKLVVGRQCHLVIVQPIRTPQGTTEGRLLYVLLDGDAPERSFFFAIFLRLSESTDVVGVAARCLRLLAPHFKSTAEAVRARLTQLPTQDLCWVPYVDSSRKQRHWEEFYTIFSRWFRPNTGCCCTRQQQHITRHNDPSSSSSSSSLPVLDTYLEPVIKVYLQGHVPVAADEHDKSKSLFPYVKLRFLFSPHASSEGVTPSAAGSATETMVVHGQEPRRRRPDDGGLVYANISFEELDEILLPKAIGSLRLQDAAAVYQMLWRSRHGAAYIQAEKFTPRRRATVSRKGRTPRGGGHRHHQQDDRVEAWSHVVTDFLATWAAHAPARLQASIADWIRREKEMQLAPARTALM